MTDDFPKEAAKRGAALLDDRCPGWWQRINPETLDMASTSMCVLGQEYGNYTIGELVLDILGREKFLGFDVAFRQGGYEDYAPLKDAWLYEIAERRIAAADEAAQEKELVTA